MPRRAAVNSSSSELFCCPAAAEAAVGTRRVAAADLELPQLSSGAAAIHNILCLIHFK